jgi:Ca2+-binding RTX toxin-like protein
MVTGRRLLGVALIGLIALLAASAVAAFTAGNAVPSGGQVGGRAGSITVNDVKPSECAGINLTHIVVGSGVTTGTAANDLILGSPGADSVTDLAGSNCFVGGAGADAFTGALGATNDCIVSNATLALAIVNCTIVARRP